MSCSCLRTPRRNPDATSPEWACVRSTGTISPPSSRSTRRGLRVAPGEIQGWARPDGDVCRSGCEPPDRGRKGRGGGGRRRAARLPAGAVSLALLRPARGRRVVRPRPARARAGAGNGGPAKAGQRAGVVVIAPLFERRAPGLYHNSAAVIDADGRVVGIYRKMHIPDDP